MSRVIWKETFDGDFHSGPGNYLLTDLALPASAAILHVDHQHQAFRVWFSVDTNHAGMMARFAFAFVPTGGDIPESSELGPRHLGTVMVDDGAFVWHIFLISISPE